MKFIILLVLLGTVAGMSEALGKSEKVRRALARQDVEEEEDYEEDDLGTEMIPDKKYVDKFGNYCMCGSGDTEDWCLCQSPLEVFEAMEALGMSEKR